jgi:transcriptional regulator with GAF, ATPase, and Fis domain
MAAEANNRTNVIARSAQMTAVMDLVLSAAETDVTVLITGESGTGKEVVANAIHFHSERHSKRLQTVHMGAIPETMAESELFGHERGAFTGAIRRKLGKFELADGGSIFLDEIGEVSLLTQVKLLRVLQDRTFNRVGGEQDIRVDVRVIAATNRDLMKDVVDGRFRDDLYYRLIRLCQIRKDRLRCEAVARCRRS